jgi:hypothetical protein
MTIATPSMSMSTATVTTCGIVPPFAGSWLWVPGVRWRYGHSSEPSDMLSGSTSGCPSGTGGVSFGAPMTNILECFLSDAYTYMYEGLVYTRLYSFTCTQLQSARARA